jgi:glycosyltransferase involved in cell wall biosynthesis
MHQKKKTRIKVGINALFLRPGNNGGIETYFYSLLSEMLRVEPENSYRVFVPLEASAIRLPSGVERVVVPVKASCSILKYFYEQVVLPSKIKMKSCDIVHSLAYIAPVRYRGASVVTIHDTNFKDFGSRMSIVRRTALKVFCTLSARRSSAVIAVSNFTRNSILGLGGVDPRRVRVIYEAGKLLDGTIGEPVKNLPREYIVTYGGRFQNKNIDRLVAAFRALPQSVNLSLVIIGSVHPDLEKSIVRRSTHGDRILRLSRVDDATAAAIIKASRGYIHPSLYEGFGMPVLEAQALGVPVAASNVSAIPEIAGQGFLPFDPYSISDIARAIEALNNLGLEKPLLVKKGLANSKRFNWRKNAEETLALYREVLNLPSSGLSNQVRVS